MSLLVLKKELKTADDVRKIINKIFDMFIDESSFTEPDSPPLLELPPPYKRGIEGQEQVKDLLIKHFHISDKSRVAHSGDIEIKSGGVNILVEVKNYSKKVPTIEVEKFYEDLNSGYNSAGLFISLHSDIIGMNSKIKLKKIMIESNTVPIIFISSDDENTIISAVKFLEELVISETNTKCLPDIRGREKLQEVIRDLGMINGDIERMSTTFSRGTLKLSNKIASERRSISDFLAQGSAMIHPKMEREQIRDVERTIDDAKLRVNEVYRDFINQMSTFQDTLNEEKAKFN